MASLPGRPWEWNCSASWSVKVGRFGRLWTSSAICSLCPGFSKGGTLATPGAESQGETAGDGGPLKLTRRARLGAMRAGRRSRRLAPALRRYLAIIDTLLVAGLVAEPLLAGLHGRLR